MTEEQEELSREIASLITDKWASWILYEMKTRGRMRFSRLMEAVEGITQKMLTKTLRQLERHGLISRTMYMEVPPRVEYELTALGEELIQAVLPFWNWTLANIETFKKAREDFDARAKQKPLSFSPGVVGG